MLYLALTSRLLPRPVCVALTGPSATGKAYLVDRVLRFFPEHAYYRLSRTSERFLLYDPEPLAHRCVVVTRALGHGGQLSRSVVGALLEDGRLRYGTVERRGGAFGTRWIEKEGPTGVLFTSAAFEPSPQDEQRCVCMTTSHAPERTRRVMAAIAAADDADACDDLPAWRELQESLFCAPARVHVPFARALAELVPPLGDRAHGDYARLGSVRFSVEPSGRDADPNLRCSWSWTWSWSWSWAWAWA